MKKNIAILLGLMALGSTALAAEDKGGMNPERSAYVGGLVGLAFPSGGSDVTFGGDFGYKLNEFLGVGAYISYLGQSVTSGNQTFTSSTTIFAAEGSYHFDDSLKGMRLGAKLGADFISSPVPGSTTNDTSTELAFGPHIAYDYSLGGGLSLGGEFNLIFVTKAGSDALPNFLGTIKWWF